jgi:predicted transcriptional regulator
MGKATSAPEKIERLFSLARRPMSFEEIRFQVPIRSDEILRALDSLVRAGKVSKSDRVERLWGTGAAVVTRTYYAWIR